MRALAVYPGEKTIGVVDEPEPRPQRDTEVLLRVLEVGICGTDCEIARFQYGAPPPGSPHLILGHELLAQALAVGEAVTRVKPGELVVTMVRRPCPHPGCVACAQGRPDFCFTGDFTERGIKGRHGFMTELVVDEERYMHVVPPHLAEVGVLVEPLSIAEKALIQVRDVQDRLPSSPGGAETESPGHGRKALVVGAGPVGLLGALAFLVRGFETWVYSLEPAGSAKARWVEAVGASYVPSGSMPLRALAERLGHVDSRLRGHRRGERRLPGARRAGGERRLRLHRGARFRGGPSRSTRPASCAGWCSPTSSCWGP